MCVWRAQKSKLDDFQSSRIALNQFLYWVIYLINYCICQMKISEEITIRWYVSVFVVCLFEWNLMWLDHSLTLAHSMFIFFVFFRAYLPICTNIVWTLRAFMYIYSTPTMTGNWQMKDINLKKSKTKIVSIVHDIYSCTEWIHSCVECVRAQSRHNVLSCK